MEITNPLNEIAVSDRFQRDRITAAVPLGLRVWADGAGWHVEAEGEGRRGLMRRVFGICARERSLRAALARASDAGLTGRDGRPMDVGTFYRHVSNQLYCGWVWHRGKVYEAVGEPIVSPGEFWALQRTLVSRRRSGRLPSKIRL